MVPYLYSHLITLIKFRTGDEVLLMVRTSTGDFCDVLAAATKERKALGLFGFEVFEMLPC